MTSGKAIALLIALFLAGAVSGGFVGFNIASHRAAQRAAALPNNPPKPPQPWPNGPHPTGFHPFESTRDRLTRELELTEDQLVKIGPIITNFDAQMKAMSEQNFINLALALSNRNERIKPFLTPEQLQKLEERAKRMHPPGPPRDHGRDEDRRDHRSPRPLSKD
jgi:hypothetical protein